MPVRIGERSWPSQRAAAADLKVSVPTLIKYLDEGREEELLLPKESRKRKDSVPAFGFPSISAAARAQGVSRSTIARRLHDAKLSD